MRQDKTRWCAYLTAATITVRSEDKAGFYKLFRNLPRKYNKIVRIFNCSDYYSV